MFEIIEQFADYLEHASLLSYPISIFLGFLAGMAAITCFLPIIPMLMGFMGGRELTRKRLLVIPLCVMLGSIIILGVLGVIVSFAGLSLQKHLGSYWPYLVGAICLVVGLFELGTIRNPGFKFPEMKSYKGFWSPLLFGMVAGATIGIGSSCCVPTLPIVLAYAGIRGNPIHGASVLAMFAIGQSIPVFAIGLFSSALGKVTARWGPYVRRVAGVLLLVVGGYLIAGKLYNTSQAPAAGPGQLVLATGTTGNLSQLSPASADANQPPVGVNNAPDPPKPLTWQEKLEMSAQQSAFAFLFVHKVENAEAEPIKEMLKKVVDQHPDKATLVEVDFDKESTKIEAFLQTKLNGLRGDLSKALPLVFVIAPNGAFTGIYDKKVSREMLEQALVSPVEADLVLSLQKGKVVFLCFYENESNELKTVKTELGAIEKLFNGVAVASYLNTNDTAVSSLMKKLPPVNNDLVTVLTVVPPGRIISRFEGSQISRRNLLAAFQSACGSGCGPSGCGPR